LRRSIGKQRRKTRLVANLNSNQGNARCCSVQLASKSKLAATMNMEEYDDDEKFEKHQGHKFSF
jgi:hypothetical protein